MLYWTIIGLIVLPFALMLGNVMFGSFREFFRALWLVLIPWHLAALAGMWHEQRWQFIKVIVFVGVCVLLVVLTHLKFAAPIQGWLAART
jgi:hypothetical protein